VTKGKDQTDRLINILEQGVDWSTRTVYIIGNIDDEKSFGLIPVVRLLDESKGPIKVFLSSHGGDESAGFAIFDALRLTKNDVRIYGFGGVYSIAALILQAGGLRFLAPHSQVMMHNGSIGIESGGSMDSDKVEQLGREAAQNNARYHEAIATRSGIAVEKIRAFCREEKYFRAEAAVELGLADGLAEDWRDL